MICYAHTFQHLFLLGLPNLSHGPLPQAFIDHLMNQADKRFAQDETLLLFTSNQKQRQATSRAANKSVKNDAASIRLFNQLIMSEDIAQRCLHAKANPKSPESVNLTNSIKQFLKITGSTIPYSQAESFRTLSQIISLNQFHGPPSFFITIAPSDTNSSLVSRLIIGCQGAAPDYQQDFNLPSLNDGNIAVAKNPVICAQVYDLIVGAIFEHLVGMPRSRELRKQHLPPSLRQSGIFGRPIAFIGVNESQARGTLHLHFLLWTDQLAPCIAQYVADNPRFWDDFSNVVDSMVKASLDDIFYEQASTLSNNHTPYNTQSRLPFRLFLNTCTTIYLFLNKSTALKSNLCFTIFTLYL